MRENTLRENLGNLVSRMHAAGVSYAEAVGQFERQFLLEVLARHNGNQCRAAKTLGMHHNTLNKKLMSFGMNSGELHKYLREQARDTAGDPKSPLLAAVP